MMINFGILGAGKIAHRFMKGIQVSEYAEVSTIYVRNIEKGRPFIKQYQLDSCTDDLDAFLANSSMDAVYIAQPNFLHYESILKCLEAGKHVLCEKPMFIDTKQAIHAFEVAQEHRCLLMEAMKVCFLPTTMQAIKWINEGKIGKIKAMTASFARASKIDENHPIFVKEYGGGALFDVGCYAVALTNQILGEVNGVHYERVYTSSGVDETTALLLSYKNDVCATIWASFTLDMDNEATIIGDKGIIRIKNFWKSHQATLLSELGDETFNGEPISEFVYQINHFCECIKQGIIVSPIMGRNETLGILKILEGASYE